MVKIFDCITFFNENFISNIRFEVINKEVDYFVICESTYDHKGNRKNLNFNLKEGLVIMMVNTKALSLPWHLEIHRFLSEFQTKTI